MRVLSPKTPAPLHRVEGVQFARQHGRGARPAPPTGLAARQRHGQHVAALLSRHRPAEDKGIGIYRQGHRWRATCATKTSAPSTSDEVRWMILPSYHAALSTAYNHHKAEAA